MNQQRDLAHLRLELAMRPIRVPTRGGGGAQPKLVIQIIGGNVLSGVDCIKYATSVTPLAVYDPDVTTSYPDGLGNAWLYVDGILQSRRVLARHAMAGFSAPALAGRRFGVLGTVQLTYSGTVMTAYSINWAG